MESNPLFRPSHAGTDEILITDAETRTLSVEEYESLEAGKDAWVAQKKPESNVIECYT